MWKFTQPDYLFRLTEEEVEDLKTQVAQDEGAACFKLARYYQCVRPYADSVDNAIELLERARSKGVVEADVAMANLWFNGDYGVVDRSKGKQLLLGALNQGCEYAAQVYLRKLIYGADGFEVDLDKAIEVLRALVESSTNPVFYYLMACAVIESESFVAAQPWLEKAYEAGITEAVFDLAVARGGGYDDDGYIVNYDPYIDTLKEGFTTAHDGIATYALHVELFAGNYDSATDEELKQEISEALIEGMEIAADLGCNAALEFMGDAHYYGRYGFEESNELAFQCYAQGAIRVSASCFEKMYEMIIKGEIEKDQDFADQCALNGARYGSEDMLYQTVKIYQQGRLTPYASEIEQYYLPIVEQMEEDLPDDDGRYDAYA